MFELLQKWLPRLLRVPPEPEAPFGAPASVRIFRASRKLYLLRLVRWSFGQAGALVGLLFWVGIIAVSEHEADRVRDQKSFNGALAQMPAGKNRMILQPLRNIPHSLFGWLWAAKGIAVVAYLGQLVVSYAAIRLDYQFRWYIVTDRSLRIRSGLWKVQELTMSYANLQQVMVSQGPLQRLLGIADVRVKSAGGGGGAESGEEQGADTLHTGIFHGVENAPEIRGLILDRLRAFRDSGLGDTDEIAIAEAPISASESRGTERSTSDGHGKTQAPVETLLTSEQTALAAAQEVLAEARKLRSALVG